MGDESYFAKVQKIYEEAQRQIIKGKISISISKINVIISRIVASFPNPIFGFVLVLLIVFAIIGIFQGYFARLDILDAIIFRVVYKITTKKKDGKK